MEKETEKHKQDTYETFVPLSELNLSNGFLFGEVMRDEEDICYTVEMQTKNRYSLPKRSRHYQEIMDVQLLPAGEIDYNKLCDSIIIFICTFDLFGKGRFLYTFENMCREEPGLVLPDGALKIFLNTEGPGKAEETPTLAEFLRYVVDKDAPVENPDVKKIKRRVEQVKRNQEMEAKYMTSLTYAREVYEDGRIDGEARGFTKGRAEGEASGLAKGRTEGKIQSILELLGELGDVPESLRKRISREENPETLGRWVKLAARAENFDDFEKKM